MIQIANREEKIQAALEDIKERGVTFQAAAKKHGVTKGTLWNRANGAQPRSEIRPHGNKLRPAAEHNVIQHALDMDLLGYPLSFRGLAQAANYYLDGQGKRPVSTPWAKSFAERSPELKAQLSRSLDCRTPFSEDPTRITAWFEHFSAMRDKYRIRETDIYNMDETGFRFIVVQPDDYVVDEFDVGRYEHIKPGERDWASAIICAGGAKTVVPPFIIFRGVCPKTAPEEAGLPPQWKIFRIKEEEWMNEEVLMEWIMHFSAHTSAAAQGNYRMLILDGHATHTSEKVRSLCEENKIILAFLPPQLSHRAQPLDLGCFGPLKHHYSQQVNTFHVKSKIDKTSFLRCFKESFLHAMTESNIETAFKEAGIIPCNPEMVLSKLKIRKKSTSRKELRQPQVPPPQQEEVSEEPEETERQQTQESTEPVETEPHQRVLSQSHEREQRGDLEPPVPPSSPSIPPVSTTVEQLISEREEILELVGVIEKRGEKLKRFVDYMYDAKPAKVSKMAQFARESLLIIEGVIKCAQEEAGARAENGFGADSDTTDANPDITAQEPEADSANIQGQEKPDDERGDEHEGQIQIPEVLASTGN